MMRYASFPACMAVALAATIIACGASPSEAQRAPSAQKAPVPPPAAPPVEPPTPETAPAAPENPGLLNELGKLIIKPSDLFPGLKLSPDAAAPVVPPPQPNDMPVAAPPAPAIAAPVPPPSPVAPSVVAAPPKQPAPALVPQMIRGRSSCPISPNGAPDCKAGADKLCQDKGYATGSSLDMDSSQTCSTKALLAGARTLKDICRTETFVTRAMCQ